MVLKAMWHAARGLQLQEHSLGRSIVALVLRQAGAVQLLGNGLFRSAPSLCSSLFPHSCTWPVQRRSSQRLALAQDGDAESLVAASAAKGGSWMDTILNLIPGRRAAASAEPSEEAIKRTHDNLRSPLLPSAVC